MPEGVESVMQASHHVCIMLEMEKGKVGGSRRRVSHSSPTQGCSFEKQSSIEKRSEMKVGWKWKWKCKKQGGNQIVVLKLFELH